MKSWLHFIIVFVLLCPMQKAFADVGKQLWEIPDGPYQIELAYSKDHLLPGADVIVETDLFQSGELNNREADFDEMRFDLQKDTQSVSSGSFLHIPDKRQIFVLTFEKIGIHQLELAFYKKGTLIASAEETIIINPLLPAFAVIARIVENLMNSSVAFAVISVLAIGMTRIFQALHIRRRP